MPMLSRKRKTVSYAEDGSDREENEAEPENQDIESDHDDGEQTADDVMSAEEPIAMNEAEDELEGEENEADVNEQNGEQPCDRDGLEDDLHTPREEEEDDIDVTPKIQPKRKIKRRRLHSEECPKNPSRKLFSSSKKKKDKKRPKQTPRQAKELSLKKKEGFESREIPEMGVWIQCENRDCRKWRFLETETDPSNLPTEWTCVMHPDDKFNSCDKPEEDYSQLEFIHAGFTEGSIVWARMPSYPWWPAMIETDPDVGDFMRHSGIDSDVTHYHCVFLDKNVSRSWVKTCSVKKFEASGKPPGSLFLKRKDFSKQIVHASERAAEALELSIQDRIHTYGFSKTFKGVWASVTTDEDSVQEMDVDAVDDEVADILGSLLSNEDMEELRTHTEDIMPDAVQAVKEANQQLKQKGSRQTKQAKTKASKGKGRREKKKRHKKHESKHDKASKTQKVKKHKRHQEKQKRKEELLKKLTEGDGESEGDDDGVESVKGQMENEQQVQEHPISDSGNIDGGCEIDSEAQEAAGSDGEVQGGLSESVMEGGKDGKGPKEVAGERRGTHENTEQGDTGEGRNEETGDTPDDREDVENREGEDPAAPNDSDAAGPSCLEVTKDDITPKKEAEENDENGAMGDGTGTGDEGPEAADDRIPGDPEKSGDNQDEDGVKDKVVAKKDKMDAGDKVKENKKEEPEEQREEKKRLIQEEKERKNKEKEEKRLLKEQQMKEKEETKKAKEEKKKALEMKKQQDMKEKEEKKKALELKKLQREQEMKEKEDKKKEKELMKFKAKEEKEQKKKEREEKKAQKRVGGKKTGSNEKSSKSQSAEGTSQDKPPAKKPKFSAPKGKSKAFVAPVHSTQSAEDSSNKDVKSQDDEPKEKEMESVDGKNADNQDPATSNKMNDKGTTSEKDGKSGSDEGKVVPDIGARGTSEKDERSVGEDRVVTNNGSGGTSEKDEKCASEVKVVPNIRVAKPKKKKFCVKKKETAAEEDSKVGPREDVKETSPKLAAERKKVDVMKETNSGQQVGATDLENDEPPEKKKKLDLDTDALPVNACNREKVVGDGVRQKLPNKTQEEVAENVAREMTGHIHPGGVANQEEDFDGADSLDLDWSDDKKNTNGDIDLPKKETKEDVENDEHRETEGHDGHCDRVDDQEKDFDDGDSLDLDWSEAPVKAGGSPVKKIANALDEDSDPFETVEE